MKKILFVFDHLESGGGTRALFNISKALSKQYLVDIIAGVSDEVGSQKLQNESQQVSHKVFSYPVRFHSSELSVLFQIVWGVTHILRHKVKLSEYEAICLNLTRSSLPFLLLKTFRRRSKLFFIFHGYIFFERKSQFSNQQMRDWPMHGKLRFWLLSHFLDTTQKNLLKVSDHVLCFSKYSNSLLTSLRLKKVRIISPPIPTQKHQVAKRKKYGVRDDAIVILINSRIEPRKGIHFALDAADILCLKYPNLVFYVVGPSYHSDYLHQVFLSLRSRNLTGKFTFLGPTTHENIQELLSITDLLLIPSISYETLGFATLEALIQGVPAIGFNSGATPELLCPINPNLVAQKISGVSLAKTIEWYLQLPSKKKKELRSNAALYASSTFNEKTFAKQFTILLDS